MEPGLYLLNYHDVSWECSYYLRGIGGSVPPDVFWEHLDVLRRVGDLVSLPDALLELERGVAFRRPAFAIWFDDGYHGVREYALPICRDFGIAAGMSVCSRFLERKEMFWEAILSFLGFADGLRMLRSRLRPLGYTGTAGLRAWLLQNFSGAVLDIIHRVYEEYCPPHAREDAFRMFDTEAGLAELRRAGWLVANHSAAHHPMRTLNDPASVRAFEECGEFLERLGIEDRYRVVPFGRTYEVQMSGYAKSAHRAFPRSMVHVETSQVAECAARQASTARTVWLGRQPNTPDDYRAGRLYRFDIVWDQRSAGRPPIPAGPVPPQVCG